MVSLMKTLFMEAQKILQANFIDILFDGRNKNYGAYELRVHYSKRLAIALAIMLAIILSLFLTAAMSKKSIAVGNAMEVNDTLTLTTVDPPVVEPPPPPPALQAPMPVETVSFTPPIIVPDDDVTEDDLPPAIDEVVDARIGTMNIDGSADEGIVAPLVEAVGLGNAVAPGPAKTDTDSIYVIVENPAEFPGGIEAWRRYLQRNLVYPSLAQENGTQGKVSVQFVVDREGNISDVIALNDPGEGLAEEAVRIIKRGPKWRPAEQNGKKVIYRHVQVITFQLEG